MIEEPISHWQRSLLTATDERFFRIIRVYLGDIKTPFNKHSLIKKLSALFRRPEISERVMSLIDRRDARVLSAVAILKEPTIGRLFRLFEGESEFLKLHYHVLNLEDRMLIYRDDLEDEPRIRFNPILADSLRLRVIDPTLVFPLTDVTPYRAHLSWPTDARILALATYLAASPPILKGDGTFRKRAAAEISRTFHEDANSAGSSLSGVSALTDLGVLGQTKEGFKISLKPWREFCSLDASSRRSFIAAASATAGSSIDVAAQAIHSLMKSMPDDASFDDETLLRLVRASGAFDNQHARNIASALTDLGMIARADSGEAVKAIGIEAAESETALMQPTGELTIPLAASLRRCWFIPLVADLRSFDTHSSYEVTRSACNRAFEAGLSSVDISSLLAELTGRPIPSNTRTSLDLWEQEHRSIRVHSGVVVLVDEDRRHFFEYDEQIRELISETAAPGIYLFRSQDMVELRKRLVAAGVDHVPLPDDGGLQGASTSLHALEVFDAPDLGRNGGPAKKAKFDRIGYEKEMQLHAESLGLSTEQRAALEDRIGRRLIVTPDQIATLTPGLESVEAKGFDYLGKVRLIQTAISSGNDLLEISGGPAIEDGSPLVVRPDELERDGNELVLVGKSVARGTDVRIRVRTISLLRKRRGSYFD